MLDPSQANLGQGPLNMPQPKVQEASTIPSKPIAEERLVSTAKNSIAQKTDTPKPVLKSLIENTMEIDSTDILNLYRDHADIRRDVAKESSDIRHEDAKGFGDTRYAIATGNCAIGRDVMNTAHDTSDKVDEAADKIQQRAADFYIAGQARDFDNARDLAALRATTDLAAQRLSQEILLASEKNAAATALESAKVAAAVALGQSGLSKEIAESKYDLSKQVAYENEKTRDLVNSLKNDELNRLLIERNTDLTHCRHDYWSARDGLFNTQFAALTSQVNSQFNALNSQVAETRQGMVNFGTMAGVGQSSTSNAVR